MLDEPQLLGRDLRIRDESAVVADQCLELAAQIAALDPVDHEPAVAGASGDAVFGVHVGEVLVDVLPGFDEVFVGGSSCCDVSVFVLLTRCHAVTGVGMTIPQLFAMASVNSWPKPVLPVGLGATTT